MPAYADVISTSHSTANGVKGKMYADLENYEDIVITGMSGRFPESSSIEEFAKNLYDGVDMVTEDDRRWKPGIHGLPTRSGKLPNLQSFDASFFSVSPRQAHAMDPQLRLLLELTYEAIVDAGYNPKELRGKRIGVYVGVSNSETEEAWTSKPDEINGYGLTGCCRAMFANRISYTFDFKGPSFAVDTACSSSMVALNTAYNALNNGEIEAAIVAGTNLTLKPQSSLQFHSLNMLANDGKCKAFDVSGNGYVRSEAAVAIFLQEASAARRVYAHLEHTRTNTDGHKNEGVTFPSGAVQEQLLRETYEYSRVPPSCVSYVEAHGTGTKVGDPQEVNALGRILCEERSTPLLIGSVKSNMGHSEPASGLCSIVKVLLSMQRGIIPGNLHFNEPNPNIPYLSDGNIKVVDKNTPWSGGYAAINSFGFGGANVHVLLRSPNYPKYYKNGNSTTIVPNKPLSKLHKNALENGMKSNIPRLITFSGRTYDGVMKTLEKIKSENSESLNSLVDKLQDMSVTSHPYRGYTVLMDDFETSIKVHQPLQNTTRPVWLIFSGMGSQWVGCGKRLMNLPIFAKAIDRCRTALLHEGIDVKEVITSEDKNAMASTPASFSAIAAVQVALIDVLHSLNIEVSGVVGHSVGELGCAYAEGCLTAEQTVQAGYWRGRAVQEATLPVGAMAAVGLNKDEAVKWCEGTDVIVACNNAHDSVTLSGSKEDLEIVKTKIINEGIFCRDVKSEGVAFHHPTLKAAAPKLLSELNKIIPYPKTRSSKWISSSVPESNWNSDIASKVSPEYLVHNLVSPVLFCEAIDKIPSNAIMVEVSPHGLLQAILRRAKSDGIAIPLIRKDAKDTIIHLFESLGRLYAEGAFVDFSTIRPTTYFPVPRDTPSISSFIDWDHNLEWDVAKFSTSAQNSEFKVEINLDNEDQEYLAGHNIDGRVLFPATGYLVLVWQALSKLKDTEWKHFPVTFSDVNLHQATVLTKSNSVTLTVRILLKKGEFEVIVGDSVAVSGKISEGTEETKERSYLRQIVMNKKVDESNQLQTKDIYKELKLRGYHYQGLFQGIQQADLRGNKGLIKWQDNWVAFLDTMLQFSLLGSTTRSLMLPVRLRKASINPIKFLEALQQENNVQVGCNQNIGVTLCEGIEIEGLKANLAPRRPISDKPLLESHQFIPYIIKNSSSMSTELLETDAVRMMIDLLIENILSNTFRCLIINKSNNDKVLNMTNLIGNACSYLPQLKLDLSYYSNNEEKIFQEGCEIIPTILKELNDMSGFHCIVICSDDFEYEDLVSVCAKYEESNENGFILSTNGKFTEQLQDKYLMIMQNELHLLSLLRKEHRSGQYEAMAISTTQCQTSFNWVEELKEKMSNKAINELWLYSKGDVQSGLIGMVNCLRREPGGHKLRYLLVDEDMTEADISNEIKKRHSFNLVSNIKNKVYGSLRHIILKSVQSEPVQHALLNVATRGDLSSLTWYGCTHPKRLLDESQNNFETCHVYYAPLNFRDIMLASGKLPPDALPGNLATKECILGLEFSGKDSAGKNIMGLVPAGGLATTVCADPYLTWNVPKEWSLKEAATVPVVYCTAYYALIVRGRLQHGESILIHSGSGGVGQAAISIALARGCTVFTTVSSEEKRNFLISRFPQLTDKNFANSRDGTFEMDVLERTNGEGVDLVLNSLAGPLLQASIRCLKQHGRFLEIGKADLSNNTALGMSVLLKNVTVHGILLDAVFEGPFSYREELNKILKEGIKSGEVRPLPYTNYSWREAEDAFRFMASGKHIGKVIIELKDEAKPQQTNSIEGVKRVAIASDEAYILTGGLGGLGLELTEWLVRRGAKDIVITSRRGPTQPYQHLCLQRWKELGVNIRVLQQDSSNVEGAKTLIREASKNHPVAGIFHLAMVLQDSLLENQDEEKFRNVCKVKAGGAIALDIASRELCTNLKYWVAFSSVACGRGNAGQSNYAWANSVCEKVAISRMKAGLQAVAIQWGGIGDVGVLADTLGEIEVGGTRPQSVRSVLNCMDVLLTTSYPVVSSMCLAASKKSSGGERGPDALVKSIANILGIKDHTKAPQNITLGDLGLDSLMSVEVVQTIEREVDIILSQTEVRNLTLSSIKELKGSDSSTNNQAQTKDSKEKVPKPNQAPPVDQIGGAWLSTQLLPATTILQLQKGDSSLPPLFIAAPIHGNCHPLKDVSCKIKQDVYGLQYPSDIPSTNIKELASFLIKEISSVTNGKPYNLAGYSFGACVAFEMTRQLETEGNSPLSLTLLDGSHSYVAAIIHGYKSKLTSPKSKFSEKVLGEVEALVLFTLQFYAADLGELRNRLLKLDSWTNRLEDVSNNVYTTIKSKSKDLNITKGEVLKAAQLFYNRLKAGLDHGIVESVISTPTLLIRAAENTRAQTVGLDYGLIKVTKEKIIIKEVPGTHESFILRENSANVSEVLNSFLTTKLALKKK